MVEAPAVMIFTIVVGALIILFFVVVSLSQGESAERNIRAGSLQRLDALLKNAGAARDSANNITIIDQTLEYECQKIDSQIEHRIGYQGDDSIPLMGTLLFAPKTLEGGNLLVYSKAADVPYRAANVLYLSTPSFRVKLDTPIPGYPANFVKTDSRPTRLVVAGDSPPRGNTVGVKPADASMQYGTVVYAARAATDTPKTVFYVGESLLIGAIVSETSTSYLCGFDAYRQQVNWVNSIERERARALASSASPACKPYYNDEPFATIDALTNTQAKPANTFTLNDARDWFEAQQRLTLLNDNLILGDACAWIY